MEHLLLLIIKKEKKRLVGDVDVVGSCVGAPIFRTFPALLFFTARAAALSQHTCTGRII